MGLLDILNGMQNGPRGQRQPQAPGSSSGGMSPIMMALLALLAYKSFKGSGAPHPSPSPSPVPGGGRASVPSGGNEPGSSGGMLDDLLNSMSGRRPGAGTPSAGSPSGGGLGDILGGLLGGGKPGPTGPGGGGLGDILGGMLSGGSAGNVLNGGLGNILKELQQQGQGRAVQSWVSTGPNESIQPSDLESAIGVDTLDELAKRSGVPRPQLVESFSEHLPELVDQLTPKGRLPTEEEASRWV